MDNLHSELRDLHDRNDQAERSSTLPFSRPIASKAPAPRVEPAAFGTGWYHDEAIAQARRDAVEARCNPYS